MRQNKHKTTEDLLKLDIAALSKAVNLTLPRVGEWRWVWSNGHQAVIGYQTLPDVGVRLIYQQAGESFDYTVRTTATLCHYGGSRLWWICPNTRCGRRVRILYGGKYFLCRKCAGCDYYQSQTQKDMLARIDKEIRSIQRKLGAEGMHVEAPTPDRPKGMHFDTFVRLTERYWVLQECYGLAQLLDLARMAKSSVMPLGSDINGMAGHVNWLLKQDHPFGHDRKLWRSVAGYE